CVSSARLIIPFHSDGPATTYIHTLSLHDAFRSSDKKMRQTVDLPEELHNAFARWRLTAALNLGRTRLTTQDALRAVVEVLVADRSEEHTSELQSRENLVCRLLLEQKKIDE